MAKDLPAKPRPAAAKPRPTPQKPQSQADTFAESADALASSDMGSSLGQTEDFNMPAREDEAGDFLLGDEAPAGPGNTARPPAQTEEFTMKPREDEDEAADFLLNDDETADGDASDGVAHGDTEVADDAPPAKTVKPKPAARTQPQEDADSDDFELNVGDKGVAAAGAETEFLDGGKPPQKGPALEETQTLDEGPAEPVKKQPGPAKAPAKTSPAKTGPTKAPPAKEGAGAAAGQQKASVLGDYKLLKKLGQGGMGAVFKAHQLSLDREVAIKVLAKELAAKPAFVQRFLREARVMAKLDHPNILRCFDVGAVQGYHYLAMEFIDGGSIEGWLKKLGKFEIGDALHIILSTAAALDHAHDLNLIHRDIKPDNILLTKKGVIKVADLGLAKATDDDLSLTKTGTGAGTPIYMAPEQARDVKHVDGRCDIYALGCMLYVFLTGEAPFKGETLVELIEAKEKGKFAPMRKFNADVPERLDLIADKMMAKKPELRYASCAEIIEEIEALGLHNERLSFLEEEEEASEGKATKDPAAPAKATAKPKSAAATQPSASKPGVGQTAMGKSVAAAAALGVTATGKTLPTAEFYFWNFTNDEGKNVTKKLKKDQLLTLIKSGSVDAQAQVSKTAKGGYRALGTYAEFAHHFKGALTKEKAERKGEKFKEMYKQIEQEEASRLRWRFFHNLVLKAGGFVGLVMWLVIVTGLVVGGFFGIKWLIYFIGTRLRDAGAAG